MFVLIKQVEHPRVLAQSSMKWVENNEVSCWIIPVRGVNSWWFFQSVQALSNRVIPVSVSAGER